MNQAPTPASSREPAYEECLLAPGKSAILLLTIAAFGVFQALWLPASSDVASLLFTAGRVLDGARLYVDVLEPNPPLIVFLKVPVEATARLFGVSALVVYPMCVLALIACSLGLCGRFRTALPIVQRQAAQLALAYILLVHVGAMFGQREHLLLILILPYAYSVASRDYDAEVSWPLVLTTGIMAGIGFSIKPFFVPALVAVELYLLTRRGLRFAWRPQAIVIGMTMVLYALVVVVFTPEYLSFARSSYSIYRGFHPFGDVPAARWWPVTFVMLAMVCGVVIVRRHAALWTDLFNILALFLALAVYIQGKLFLYHWYPALSIAGVLYSVGAATAFLHCRPLVRIIKIDLVLALLIPSMCVLEFLYWSQSPRTPVELKVLVQKYAKGDTIMALSSARQLFPLANETGVGWASRHPLLWQIQGYYQTETWTEGGYHSWNSMPEGERDFMRSVVSDLERARPALLFVDTVPPTSAMAGFDYLEYFSLESRFAAFMAHYEFLETVDRFRIYKRL